MFRFTLFAAAVLTFIAGTAQAQSACETNRRACLRSSSCLRLPEPQRAQCREDVETFCAKEFSRCLEEAPPASAGTEPGGSAVSSGSNPQCKHVFSSLRTYAEANPGHRIHLVWTTNYFGNNVRYAAWTEMRLRSLSPQSRDLLGEGKRHRTLFQGRADLISSYDVENVSLRIRADGKILLQEQYGPYEPSCSRRWVATVNTGDSIEVLNLKPSYHLTVLPPGTPPPDATPPDTMPPVGTLQPQLIPNGLAASAQDGARQWRVANSDTVNGNDIYELHNMRRPALNLSSQLGAVRRSGSDDLTWPGHSGGHFVFVRANLRNHRPVSENEIVALYNTQSRRYLKGLVHLNDFRWSAEPSYEWQVRARVGADFALYNVNARDYLVLDERPRRNDFLTYQDCAKKWPNQAMRCALTYARPPSAE